MYSSCYIKSERWYNEPNYALYVRNRFFPSRPEKSLKSTPIPNCRSLPVMLGRSWFWCFSLFLYFPKSHNTRAIAPKNLQGFCGVPPGYAAKQKIFLSFFWQCINLKGKHLSLSVLQFNFNSKIKAELNQTICYWLHRFLSSSRSSVFYWTESQKGQGSLW